MAEVDVVNWAFSMIGEAPITSGEWALEASGAYPRTRKAYAIYAKTRDGLIRSYYWNSCKKLAEIMQDTITPIHTYGTAYSLPADCLRILHVHPIEEQIPYKIIGQKLYCDDASGPDAWAVGTYYPVGKYVTASSVTYKCVDAHTGADDKPVTDTDYWESQSGDYAVLDVTYIYQNTTDTTWDALLTEMVATKLALQLCITLASDKEIWARMTEYYTKILLPQAKTIDAQDSTPDDIITDSWLNEMN